MEGVAGGPRNRFGLELSADAVVDVEKLRASIGISYLETCVSGGKKYVYLKLKGKKREHAVFEAFDATHKAVVNVSETGRIVQTVLKGKVGAQGFAEYAKWEDAKRPAEEVAQPVPKRMRFEEEEEDPARLESADLEEVIDALEQKLGMISTRFEAIRRCESGPSLVARLSEESTRMLADNLRLRRELSDLQAKHERMREARGAGVERVVYLEGLTKKYRDVWGDLDPKALKDRLAPGVDVLAVLKELNARTVRRHQSEAERVALQAMQDRAVEAEGALAAMRAELGRAHAERENWKRQVGFQRGLVDDEAQKVTQMTAALRDQEARHLEWVKEIGVWQERAARFERETRALAAENGMLKEGLARQALQIESLRAGADMVVKREYEVKMETVKEGYESRIRRIDDACKKKIAHIKDLKDKEALARIGLQKKLDARE